MKRVICLSICLFLLLINAPVFATTKMVKITVKNDSIKITSELLELFPEANIDEKLIAKALQNYENEILPMSMRADAVAIDVYTKKISEKEISTLEVYEDGSFVLFESKREHISGNLNTGWVTETVTSSYNNLWIWRFAITATFKWDTSSGYGYFTANRISDQSRVRSLTCTYSNKRAYARGNILQDGFDAAGIEVWATLGHRGSTNTGFTLGPSYPLPWTSTPTILSSTP